MSDAHRPMDEKLSYAVLFGGQRRLVTTHKRVGNKVYLGGYSIDYDRNGIEVSRTENRWNCVMDCGDNKLATQAEGWLHNGE